MSKDVNKKENMSGESRKKINPFDVIIVLLIICLLGTLGYRVYDGIKVENASAESKYVVSFECDGAYNSVLKHLENDTPVYLKSGELLGYIYVDGDGEAVSILGIVSSEAESSVNVENPAPEELPQPDDANGEDNITDIESGTYEETVEEDTEIVYEKVRFCGKIRLSREADKVENGGYYSIGETNVAVGSFVEVHTDKVVFFLKVISVDPIE